MIFVDTSFWVALKRIRDGHHDEAIALARANAGAQHVVARDLEHDAWQWLRRRDDREFSFVDATSFAFMAERGLQDALSFDDDFAAAGFRALRA